MKPKVSYLSEKLVSVLSRLDAGQPSKLDIDIAMSELRLLYEELDALRNKQSEPVIQRQVDTPAETTARIEKTWEEKINATPIPVKETIVTVVTEKAPVNGNPENIPKKLTGSSLNDIATPTDNLNARHKSPARKEVHRQASNKRLKEFIDLNKKFVLINSLFSNNAESFAKAIEQIDTYTDYESAQVFISQTLSTDFKWNPDSESVGLLTEIVKQRFGIEE